MIAVGIIIIVAGTCFIIAVSAVIAADLYDEECEKRERKNRKIRSSAMDTREDILKRDFSEDYVGKMKNAIEMSHYKYGWASKTYPELAQARKCIVERLDLYNKTHNKDYLVDIGNFAMLEYMYPSYEDAEYTPTDSDRSPGLAGGISYKELMEEMTDEL